MHGKGAHTKYNVKAVYEKLWKDSSHQILELTIKASIKTGADNILKYAFITFREIKLFIPCEFSA